MIEGAPAKVNLALHLRRRRPDGYHDLETLFAFTDFGDTLEVSAATGLSLSVTGRFAAAVGDGDNLVLRAARALAEAANRPADAALTLDKNIPVAAGLGGGSADAAATLRLLARFWQLGWSLDRLAAIGAALGADVPACVHGRTMLGTGRGDELTAIDLQIGSPAVLLVNPLIAVPTGLVFARWDGVDRGGLQPADWSLARNDLTPSAVSIAPVIAEVVERLETTGSSFVRMSGSGATCLALYDDQPSCEAAAAVIRHTHPEWWWVSSSLRR